MTNLTRARWRKSSYSGDNNGQCVEVAYVGGLRDSKNPGPTLAVNVPALIAAVKADVFTR
jgi:hypothetical protein